MQETRFLKSAMWARNLVSTGFALGGEKLCKKPGFWNLRCGRETGFLRVLHWVARNYARNPVSEIFDGGEKPGFYEFCIWWREITQETRFLKSSTWARNRVSTSFALGNEKSPKKPGFLNLRRGRETGFLRVLHLVARNYARNPVSEIFDVGEKPDFYESCIWWLEIMQETRFLKFSTWHKKLTL